MQGLALLGPAKFRNGCRQAGAACAGPIIRTILRTPRQVSHANRRTNDMTTPSALSTGIFVLIVLAVAALLANIVIVAALSTPMPFRAFTQGPTNLLRSTFPYVWLPTFLVQAALFGHLVVFRALRNRGTR